MTPEEQIKNLKCEAYDCMANVQYLQNRLVDINKEIARIANQQQGKPAPEAP